MPTTRQAIPVDPLLTNFSLAYMQDRAGLTADFIFPRVPTGGKNTGTYYTYNRDNTINIPNAKRVPKTAYNQIDWKVASATFATEDFGLRDGWDDSDARAALNPLNLPQDTAEIVTDLVLLAFERRIHAIVTDNSVVTQTAAIAAANRWNTVGGGDPFANMNTALKTVESNAFVTPNRVVWGNEVWRDGIQNNPNIISRVQNVMLATGKNINVGLAAQSFDLDDGRTSKFVYNSAKEGQTISTTYSFGKNVLVFFANPSQNLKTVTLGRTFEKRSLETRRYRDDEIKTTWVDVSHETDEKLVTALSAYLLTTVVD